MITPEMLIDIIRNFGKRADASHVIVTMAALEDLLEQALLGRMHNIPKEVYERLFTGYGPLSSFSAKIDLALALGMFDEAIARDFHALRELGNEFAHTKTMLHFGSNDVQPFLQNLHGWRKEADPKSLFDERVSALTVILTQHLEASNFADALLSQDHFDQT